MALRVPTAGLVVSPRTQPPNGTCRSTAAIAGCEEEHDRLEVTVRELKLIGHNGRAGGGGHGRRAGAVGDGGAQPGLVESVRDGLADAISAATRRAYQSDWRGFAAWCESAGTTPCPPTRLPSRPTCGTSRALGARSRRSPARSPRSARATRRPATSPRARPWSSARRSRRSGGGWASRPRQKAPILADQLRRMVAALGTDLQGLRDRALLLVGFAGAFRRSELVALDVRTSSSRRTAWRRSCGAPRPIPRAPAGPWASRTGRRRRPVPCAPPGLAGGGADHEGPPLPLGVTGRQDRRAQHRTRPWRAR